MALYEKDDQQEEQEETVIAIGALSHDTDYGSVAVSGGFDPVHTGHVALFKEAAEIGSQLTVILNCDDWLQRKKGKHFMNENDRAEILQAFEVIDEVFIDYSEEKHIADALRQINPDVFANGGDRKDETEIPDAEIKTAKKFGIKLVFGVGGDKKRSSSELLQNYCKS